MMKRTLLLAWLAAASPAWAEGDFIAPSDNRIKTLVYDKNDIYTINTRYGYQTSLEFSELEQIETISIGDRSMWQIIPTANRLFIRPMDENVSTNMTIITNRHTYQFDIKSGNADAAKNPNTVYVARFVYPNDEKRPHVTGEAVMAAPDMPPTGDAFDYSNRKKSAPSAVPMASVVPAPAAAAPLQPAPMQEMPASSSPAPLMATPAATAMQDASPASLNYSYTYTGDDAKAPTQVYDDGRSTYFQLSTPGSKLPQIIAVGSNGNESEAVPYLKDGYVVVDVIAPRFLLKYGDARVHVYNESLL